MKKKIVIKLSGKVFGMDNAKIIQNYADFLIKISKICQPVVIAGGGVIARHYISHARNFNADESTLDELGIEISRLNAKLLIYALKNKAYSHPPTTLQQVKHAVDDGLIVVNGWQETTKISLIDAVNEFVEMGFSEFLSTSIDRDGTLQGPDLKWLQQINEIKNLNIIASGGISSIEDVNKVKEIDPFGVILGKALYENKVSIEEVKKLI